MAIIVGIDEAGVGPILGPLVVTSTAFSVPDELVTKDLWQLLRKSTAKTKKNLIGRLLISDSKKAYTRSAGLGHLQRTSLAALKCLNLTPANLNQLMHQIAPECASCFSRYPWYKNLHAGKIPTDSKDIHLAASVFARDMNENGLSLEKIYSTCFDVYRYNEMIKKTDNKSSTVFGVTCTHIQKAFDYFAGENLHLIVDRQGGRTRYGSHLMKIFPSASLTILKENSLISSYELISAEYNARIHFVVKADDKHLPVSLSSMMSKYIRELFMAEINSWFARYDQNLKPTAGYYSDGKRFLDHLDKHMTDLKFDRGLLVRLR